MFKEHQKLGNGLTEKELDGLMKIKNNIDIYFNLKQIFILLLLLLLLLFYFFYIKLNIIFIYIS